MKVLIVEDDMTIQQFLVSALKRLNPAIYIYQSNSASQALVIAKTEQIDFFIVDIQLVDYKGTDFVRQIRAMPTYQFAPIIFETGIVTEELYAYRELKCFYYLVKPYTEAEFRKVIEDVFCFLSYTSQDEQTLKIEQKGYIFEYYIKDIVYIESFGKKISLHLDRDEHLEEVILSSYSLKRMSELVGDRFIQLHKSYIVNREKIEVVDKVNRVITLRGYDVKVPIGLKFLGVLK